MFSDGDLKYLTKRILDRGRWVSGAVIVLDYCHEMRQVLVMGGLHKGCVIRVNCTVLRDPTELERVLYEN